MNICSPCCGDFALVEHLHQQQHLSPINLKLQVNKNVLYMWSQFMLVCCCRFFLPCIVSNWLMESLNQLFFMECARCLYILHTELKAVHNK